MMRQSYGSAWVSMYGSEPSDTWMRKLATLSDDQLRQGLNAVVDRASEFPPNLGQFVDMCGGSSRPPHLRYDPETDGLALPDLGKRERAEKARDVHLPKLREALKGKA